MTDKQKPATPAAEQMDGASLDIAAINRAQLKALFPAVFTETRNDKGELVESVDFEKLKAELGTFTDLFESRRERFGMDWPGKKDALKLIQTPTYATLKPARDESVNFDTTENLFIEGDNLEVLKLLQKSYYGKVKMIYIDPPYNTRKDFIYPDNFSESLETYLQYAGLLDDDGRKKETSFTSEGRFHTRWLNMIYPRLYLARNLLSDDGVIFISIDDNEVHNLKSVCNEVFGEENFLVQFAWRTDGNFDNQAKFKQVHEYILVYGKAIEEFPHPPTVDPSVPRDSKIFKEEIRNTIVKNGPKNPPSALMLPAGFPADFDKGTIAVRSSDWPHYRSEAIIRDGVLTKDSTVYSGWSSKNLATDFIRNNCQAVPDSKGQMTRFVIAKSGAIEAIKDRSDKQSHVISTLSGFGGPQKAAAEIEALGVVFDDYPKPVGLIKYLLSMVDSKDFIAMDFFAGSGTTAQAVAELNKEDGGQRKFVLVQLPERCKEESAAAKAGFKTISDIAAKRIRALSSADLLGGCSGVRMFKLDRSNFKPWQRLGNATKPEDLSKQLELHVEHIRSGTESEHLLFELLIKSGFTPTEKVTVQKLAGIDVYSVADGGLLICLADKISRELIDAVAAAEPLQFVCLDSAFAGNDQLKANAVQTFTARNQGRDKTSQIVFRTI